MTDPQEPGAHERYPEIPTLETDESVAPRPEEEAADAQRGPFEAAEGSG